MRGSFALTRKVKNRAYLAWFIFPLVSIPAMAATGDVPPRIIEIEEGYGCGVDKNQAVPSSLTNAALATIEGLPPKVATGEGNNAVSYATVRRFYDTVQNTSDYFRLLQKSQPSWGNATLSHATTRRFYDTD